MIKKINNRSILILLYLTLCFVSGVLYLSSTDLQPDEAHYWVWSTRLQAGYFDNSPLVAFIIRFSTALFGQSEFGVRFPAALSFILLNLILYFFTLRVSEKKSTALLSVFLFSSMPVVLLGTHLMTHDVPLMVFAALTWFFLYQAIVEEKYNRWYPAGFFWGLALLSKYQAVLIGVSVLFLLLLRRENRVHLTRKEPYLAVLIALALFSPTLYWNSQNNWVSFVFQSRHGIQLESKLKLANVLEFYVGQAGITSLIFFPVLIYYTLKKLLRPRSLTPVEAFLMAGYVPVLVFFSITSLTYTALANWPLQAYFTAPVFLALQLTAYKSSRRKGRQILFAVFVFLIIAGSWSLVCLARYPQFFIDRGLELPPEIILSNELYGWRELGRFLEAKIDENFPGETMAVPVFAERYLFLSEILFYTHRPIHAFAAPRYRLSQFDLWTIKEIDSFEGKGGLLVSGDREWELFSPYFERITELGKVEYRRFGHLVRAFHVFKVEGIKSAAIKEALQNKGLGY